MNQDLNFLKEIFWLRSKSLAVETLVTYNKRVKRVGMREV